MKVVITSRNIDLINYALDTAVAAEIEILINFNKDKILKPKVALELWEFAQKRVLDLRQLIKTLENANNKVLKKFDKTID